MKRKSSIKFRSFGDPHPSDDEDNFGDKDNPQLELLLKKHKFNYRSSYKIPFEILVNIFEMVINTSDNPLKELCTLARTCEAWRHIVLSQSRLWSRLDMSNLPITDRNIKILRKIFSKPDLLKGVRCIIYGGALKPNKDDSSFLFETLPSTPNLEEIVLKQVSSVTNNSIFYKAVQKWSKIKRLTVSSCRGLLSRDSWLVTFLATNGQNIEKLDLCMSLNTVTPSLLKQISSCSTLKYLDLSTSDCVNTRSFDANILCENLPNLEVFRCANVSFKRVTEANAPYGLPNLQELSIPIATRDVDRDDALFATLTYGSNKIRRLDLRGSTISFRALLDLPSPCLEELHIDDTCPTLRREYYRVFERFSSTLTNISLVKINCSETISSCLRALYNCDKRPTKLRKIDLSGSDVSAEVVCEFLKNSQALQDIDLASCRSLPRGCKGTYTNNPFEENSKPLHLLVKRLRRG